MVLQQFSFKTLFVEKFMLRTIRIKLKSRLFLQNMSSTQIPLSLLLGFTTNGMISIFPLLTFHSWAVISLLHQHTAFTFQLIRYARACLNYQDFMERGKVLTTKLLSHGYQKFKLVQTLKFCRRHRFQNCFWCFCQWRTISRLPKSRTYASTYISFVQAYGHSGLAYHVMLTIRGRLITPLIFGFMSVGLNILIRHSFTVLWVWITAWVPWSQVHRLCYMRVNNVVANTKTVQNIKNDFNAALTHLLFFRFFYLKKIV